MACEANIINPVSDQEEVWLQLVDEPIAAIIAEIEAEDPELRTLVASPEKLLAFRTFANIRVGVVLGRLLVEEEVEAYDGSDTWVQALLKNPEHRREIVAEVRAVAEELAQDAEAEGASPDEATKARFRDFARRELDLAGMHDPTAASVVDGQAIFTGGQSLEPVNATGRVEGHRKRFDRPPKMCTPLRHGAVVELHAPGQNRFAIERHRELLRPRRPHHSLPRETRRAHVDDERRREDPDQRDDEQRQAERRGHVVHQKTGIGIAPPVLVFRKDWNEGLRESAFREQPAQEIRDAECDVVRVHRRAGPKDMGQHRFARETEQAARHRGDAGRSGRARQH